MEAPPKFSNKVENACKTGITVSHRSGCPVYSARGYVGFITNNPWIMGTIFVIGGFVLGLWGRKFFPYMVAATGAILGFTFLALICSAFGGYSSTVGSIICSIVCLVLAILFGIFLRRRIWLSIGILGVFGGFLGGQVLYALLLAAFGLKSFWAMLFISIFCAIGGGFLAYYAGPHVVLYGTAGIGAYGFMRGWTYFFGGYPNEGVLFSQLKEGVDIKLEWPFWVYFGVFVCSFVFAVYYQHKYTEEHNELDEDENYKRQKTSQA